MRAQVLLTFKREPQKMDTRKNIKSNFITIQYRTKIYRISCTKERKQASMPAVRLMIPIYWSPIHTSMRRTCRRVETTLRTRRGKVRAHLVSVLLLVVS